jgi:hypothetical protein
MNKWMKSAHATLEDEPSYCPENWGVIHQVTRRHSPEIRDPKAETVHFAEKKTWKCVDWKSVSSFQFWTFKIRTRQVKCK